jgi:hypothetical protein
VVAVLEELGLDKSLEHQARGYIHHKDQLGVEERKVLVHPEKECNQHKDQQQEERKV